LLIFLLLPVFQTAAAPPLQEGLIALRDGKLRDARADFEAALEGEPKNAFAWVSLAETCRRIGDAAAANDAAQKAEEFGADIPAVDHALASFYTQEEQFARAAKLEEKYAVSPKADLQASLRTAELYQRAGDPAAAEAVLKRALEQRSTDPAVAFAYAQMLLKRLDFPAADKAVAAARAAHPKDAQLLLATGVARYGERRFDDAIDEFLQVIALDPAIPQPYDFLGRMMEHAGARMPAIRKAFEARLASAPDDALANLVLAKAKLNSDSKDASAEALLRHSIAIDPSQWEAHYELGVLLENKHDFQGAAEELNRAVSVNAKEPMPHYHLARVYDRLGDSERAQAERKLHEQLSGVQN
jgi:tetratricopeptide (TPR) repeat protein